MSQWKLTSTHHTEQQQEEGLDGQTDQKSSKIFFKKLLFVFLSVERQEVTARPNEDCVDSEGTEVDLAAFIRAELH